MDAQSLHIVVDAATIYVGGSFSDVLEIDGQLVMSAGGNDAFLAAFDTGLQLKWLRRCGGVGNDDVRDLAVTADGDVVVAMSMAANTSSLTSYSVGPFTLGGRGNTDAVVACYTAAGTVAWARNDGGTSFDIPDALCHLSNGSIVTTGTFGKSSRFGTTPTFSPSSQCAYVHVVGSDGNHRAVAIPEIANQEPVPQVRWPAVCLLNGVVGLVSEATGPYQMSNRMIDGPSSTSAQVLVTDTDLQLLRTISVPYCARWIWAADGTHATIARNDVCDSIVRGQLLLGELSAAPIAVGYVDHPFTESEIIDIVSLPEQIALAGTLDHDLVWNTGSRIRVVSSSSTRVGFLARLGRDGTNPDAMVLRGRTGDVRLLAMDGRSSEVALVHTDGSFQAENVNGGVVYEHAQPCAGVALAVWTDAPTTVEESSPLPSWQPGHIIDVYSLVGQHLGTVTAETLEHLPVGGPLLLRQDDRVSLCYVYSPQHIAYALPASSTR